MVGSRSSFSSWRRCRGVSESRGGSRSGSRSSRRSGSRVVVGVAGYSIIRVLAAVVVGAVTGVVIRAKAGAISGEALTATNRTSVIPGECIDRAVTQEGESDDRTIVGSKSGH